MPSDQSSPRELAWRDRYPWFMLTRPFRLAISLPILFLASLGTVLTPLGWNLAEIAFEIPAGTGPRMADFVGGELPPLTPQAIAHESWSELAQDLTAANVVGVYQLFVHPLLGLLDREASVRELAYWVLGGLWTVLVWAFFAGAITRIAAVQLGREERLGLLEAVRHVRRNYLWYALAPLFPLVGILFLAIPIAVLGLAMRLLDLGVVAAGIVWLLVLLDGLAIVVILLGSLPGWPLMWPTISCEEGGDAFEAFSRCYQYTFQRPLNLFFYAVVTVLYGALCWFLVWAVASSVIEVSYGAAAWGAGNARIQSLVELPEQPSRSLRAGSALIHFGNSVVRTIAVAFNHAFFWCAATAVYLCMRRDVDETEFDEVFLEAEESRYALPSSSGDEAGASPTVPAAGESQPGEERGSEASS